VTTPTLTTPAEALDRARQLAPRLAARAEAHDHSGTFASDDLDDLRAAGLLGLMSPERLGGAGAGFADYARVAMELAAGSGATALVFNMHASVTGALASTPDELARAMGVPESFFTMRDRVGCSSSTRSPTPGGRASAPSRWPSACRRGRRDISTTATCS
jgi:alkylation response protein AidB-like acyl-CoA dehydrogenase